MKRNQKVLGMAALVVLVAAMVLAYATFREKTGGGGQVCCH